MYLRTTLLSAKCSSPECIVGMADYISGIFLSVAWFIFIIITRILLQPFMLKGHKLLHKQTRSELQPLRWDGGGATEPVQGARGDGVLGSPCLQLTPSHHQCLPLGTLLLGEHGAGGPLSCLHLGGHTKGDELSAGSMLAAEAVLGVQNPPEYRAQIPLFYFPWCVSPVLDRWNKGFAGVLNGAMCTEASCQPKLRAEPPLFSTTPKMLFLWQQRPSCCLRRPRQIWRGALSKGL